MSEIYSGYAVLAVLLVLLAAGGFLAWPIWRRVLSRTEAVRSTGSGGVAFMLILIGLASAVAFTFLTAAVLESTTAFRLDVEAGILTETLRLEPVERVFGWITHLGDIVTLLAATAVGVCVYAAYARSRPLWPFAFTVLGAQAATWLAKYLVDKPRPDLSHLDPTLQVVSPSFPSAHAAGALTVYGFLAYLSIRTIRAPRHRARAWYSAGVVITIIGLSRILLGVHFTTDVLGGWLLGGFWLCLGIAADMRVARRDGTADDAE